MKDVPGQISLFDMMQSQEQPQTDGTEAYLKEANYQPPKKRRCAATNEECNHENCKKVAIECLDIDCKANCCQACTEMCGARCNYSAHQPKVRKEYVDINNQTWVDNPNYQP